MAIRRPSISSPEWLFQDFLYQSAPGSEERYLQIKWDGEIFERVSESFDYSSPPYTYGEQRGGEIVGQINYTVNNGLVTINSWEVDWRDEWPLRLGVEYLKNCLYPPQNNFTIIVQGQEVYNQAGNPLVVVDKDPYAFWVSEQFHPLSNKPNDYLVRLADPPAPPSPEPKLLTLDAFVQPLWQANQIVLGITLSGYPLQTEIYWEITGPKAAQLLVGPTKGVIFLNVDPTFVNLLLEYPIPSGSYPLTVSLYQDAAHKELLATDTVTVTG